MTRAPRSRLPARWALQDAKNRLSEVVDAAVRGQPQVVTRRGVETAVIISHEDYARMTAAPTEGPTFADYLIDGPVVGGGEPFERIALRARRGT
jgi:antitoxin Phd